MYQSSKPFRIDMKMFHNKTNAAFYEQQNMGNTQLNLNPSEISLIFSQSNVGGQFLWAMFGGGQPSLYTWLSERLPRSLPLPGQGGCGEVSALDPESWMVWCACWGCGEQKGECSFGQVALDSVNMTFILVVVSSNTAQGMRAKCNQIQVPCSPSHRWFCFSTWWKLNKLRIPQPIQNWNL